MEHLDHRELLELLEHLDHRELLELLEQQDHLVQMELRELLDFLVTNTQPHQQVQIQSELVQKHLQLKQDYN